MVIELSLKVLMSGMQMHVDTDVLLDFILFPIMYIKIPMELSNYDSSTLENARISKTFEARRIPVLSSKCFILPQH